MPVNIFYSPPTYPTFPYKKIATHKGDRTADDAEVLLEFARHLRAFGGMSTEVRRALVRAMVFAVVEKAGTVVMTHGEELDSWSVVINGQVEVRRILFIFFNFWSSRVLGILPAPSPHGPFWEGGDP